VRNRSTRLNLLINYRLNLSTGIPEQVKTYVKGFIDVVGKDGGLVVDCGSIIDEARHGNVKAMIEYTKEYGRYE
jgi:hypothetical protein